MLVLTHFSARYTSGTGLISGNEAIKQLVFSARMQANSDRNRARRQLQRDSSSSTVDPGNCVVLPARDFLRVTLPRRKDDFKTRTDSNKKTKSTKRE